MNGNLPLERLVELDKVLSYKQVSQKINNQMDYITSTQLIKEDYERHLCPEFFRKKQNTRKYHEEQLAQFE